jgi:hypothetical protein
MMLKYAEVGSSEAVSRPLSPHPGGCVPRFPKSEAKVAELAMRIADGLARATGEFASPPVSPAVLSAQLEAFHEKKAALVATRAKARMQRADKIRAFKTLKDSMRANLRYAEVTVRRQPELLGGLGWGPRRPRTPLKPPGEVRDITIQQQGDTWLLLTWNAPAAGGAVAVYSIQRRTPPDAWEDVATSMDTIELLREQPRGVDLEYRVLAMNRAGTGSPSATATAVL